MVVMEVMEEEIEEMDVRLQEVMVELEAMEAAPLPLVVMEVTEEAMGEMEVRPQEVIGELEVIEAVLPPLEVMAVMPSVAMVALPLEAMVVDIVAMIVLVLLNTIGK